MKIPGPDHPIAIERHPRRVQVRFNGRTVADTTRALILRETTYKPVFYIPRDDADMTAFERSSHATHCPYKGDASYFSIRVGDRLSENAIWSYEQPFPAVGEIAELLAFYPNRVDSIDES